MNSGVLALVIVLAFTAAALPLLSLFVGHSDEKVVASLEGYDRSDYTAGPEHLSAQRHAKRTSAWLVGGGIVAGLAATLLSLPWLDIA